MTYERYEFAAKEGPKSLGKVIAQSSIERACTPGKAGRYFFFFVKGTYVALFHLGR